MFSQFNSKHIYFKHSSLFLAFLHFACFLIDFVWMFIFWSIKSFTFPQTLHVLVVSQGYVNAKTHIKT